jgi:hypothetical protein
MTKFLLPRRSGVPSLSTDKVTVVDPLDAVVATVSVGVGDGASVIGPEGIVVAVVVSSAAWSACTGDKLGVVAWESESSNNAECGSDERSEANHAEAE